MLYFKDKKNEYPKKKRKKSFFVSIKQCTRFPLSHFLMEGVAQTIFLFFFL